MPTQPPPDPKIYHIVHVDRLASIVADGGLWCDARMMARQAATGTTIGMTAIKQRRLTLPVHGHAPDTVGDFMPFYFCPRSIMLYVIHCANHPDLIYRGGQGPIVHLEADLNAVVAWANARNRQWAFALSNAGAVYAQFRDRLDQLDELNWPAIAATDFRKSDIRQGKQAEFLVKDSFPWPLVSRIGVINPAMAQQVARAIQGAAHRPVVEVLPGWYY